MSDNEKDEVVDNRLQIIINNAKVSGREISLFQAKAILSRSLRLQKEGKRSSTILSPEVKARQIDKCWRQRRKKIS